MTAAGIALRWLHLATVVFLMGHLALLLLAGRSQRPAARAWDKRILSQVRWLGALALLSGIGTLAHQAALVEGRPRAAVDFAVWLRVLGETRYGTAWLARHGLLALLAAFVLLRRREQGAADWIAFRVQAALLAVAAGATLVWAGHAAAIDPGGAPAVMVDALHLLSGGLWLGALPPLAQLLRLGATDAGAEMRPFAVIAVRRFSALALPLMMLVVGSGLWNAWAQVADLPRLLGTRYGPLVLAKVALLVPILAFALASRRMLPALSGDGATVGRPAMARVASGVVVECALGLAILAVVATLSLTPPARHDSPWWPLSFRLSYAATAPEPGVAMRLLIGSQLALIGLLGLIVAMLLRRARMLVGALGVTILAAGLATALPPLAVDAYPTTYRRPLAPYQAFSVANGRDLFDRHCAGCHGPEGRGDGTSGAGLPRPPADLTAPHTARHTAGDLFWWISNGIGPGGMPGFTDRLSEAERWDLVNFLRALSAAAEARRLTSSVEARHARLVAPDFVFSTGPDTTRALRELRGRRVVLLVLFRLPTSRERLGELATRYESLVATGGEIIAVPMDGEGEILRRLGANPRILFPVATEGGAEITRTYSLFAPALQTERTGPGPGAGRPMHLELLIDRQGYVRARWAPGLPSGWDDLARLLAQLEALRSESPAAPPPDEHVH